MFLALLRSNTALMYSPLLTRRGKNTNMNRKLLLKKQFLSFVLAMEGEKRVNLSRVQLDIERRRARQEKREKMAQ